MNNKLLSFLSNILGNYKIYSGEEVYFKCPFCNHPDNKKKLAINLNENDKKKYTKWHCWRDPSHAGNNLFTLLKRLNSDANSFSTLSSILGIENKDLSKFEDVIFEELTNKNNYNIKQNNIYLPNEFKSFLNSKKNVEYNIALNYLIKKRKLSPYDVVKYKLGYCNDGKYDGYIIIPSYGSDGNINYFETRSYQKNSFRFLKPPHSKDIIFNEMFINWNHPIILVEGWFDAVTLKRNAIPLLGKTLMNSVKEGIIKNKVKKVYLMLDSDAIRESTYAIEYLLKNNISINFVDLPSKKDPNDLGFYKSWELINNSKEITLKDLIKYKLKF